VRSSPIYHFSINSTLEIIVMSDCSTSRNLWHNLTHRLMTGQTTMSTTVSKMAITVLSAVKVHLWIRSSNFWSCSVVLFLLQLGRAVLGAPSPRLLEMAVCRQYFESHDPKGIPPDGNMRKSICKGPETQRTFVFMLSAISTCTNLAGNLEILYIQAFVS
jgi:hypothetical protein